ncbi:Protein CBG17503 [Caenorhabditis briggsae]|uniref:Protein CBG17503 n=1 Tax=Caenorhabditis briggsae TaxID=6238 RepID=A8XRC0_CAEBR|nr:Protein CBG17503 [Caenorhabditis briggsae]CAP35139.2 Protein CBG17503 [Caenorhabditis briggsae]
MKICVLLLLTHCAIAAEWQCGSGRFSTAVAYILSLPATDRDYINSCCKAHDQQYDLIQNRSSLLTTQESDYIFKECLAQSNFGTLNMYEHIYSFPEPENDPTWAISSQTRRELPKVCRNIFSRVSLI